MKQREVSTKIFADKYSVSVRRVQKLIQEGRIPARKVGREWFIPVDAEYPDDMRYKD